MNATDLWTRPGRLRAACRPLVLALGLWAAAGSGHAALFGDDEARRAIIDLRARVEANRQAAEAADRQLTQELDNGVSPLRRSLR